MGEGWICPKCDVVWGPHVDLCKHCSEARLEDIKISVCDKDPCDTSGLYPVGEQAYNFYNLSTRWSNDGTDNTK
jgi:hypothetical protein